MIFSLKDKCLNKKPIVYYTIAFFLIETLYVLTIPENRLESDDGFMFAYAIRELSFVELFENRLLLYQPLTKLLYQVPLLLGVDITTYVFINFINTIFSSLTVLLLFRFINKTMKMDVYLGLIVSSLFAFSYEFWRYSGETEVYSIANLMIVIYLNLFFDDKFMNQLKGVILLAIYGGFCVLIYKANVIPLFFCLPLFFLFKKEYDKYLLYGLIGCAVVLLGYYMAFMCLPEQGIGYEDFLLGGTKKYSGSKMTAFFVIVSNQLATNWMYGFEFVTFFLMDQFPYKVIAEEAYMGQYIGVIKYFSIITLALSIVLLFINIYLTRGVKTRGVLKKYMILFSLWATVYGLFVLYFDPNSNEPWLMIQIPLIIIFGIVIIEPVIRGGRFFYPVSLVCILFLHNLIGGFWVINTTESDYNFHKSEWLVENATSCDVIILMGPESYFGYLKYHSKATVFILEDCVDNLERIITSYSESGSIFFTQDVIHPYQRDVLLNQKIINGFNSVINDLGYEIKIVDQGFFFQTYGLSID